MGDMDKAADQIVEAISQVGLDLTPEAAIEDRLWAIGAYTALHTLHANGDLPEGAHEGIGRMLQMAPDTVKALATKIMAAGEEIMR